MPAPFYAANYTHVAAGQTAEQIAGGASIVVNGIIVSGEADAVVTLLTSAGATIGILRVPIDTSFEVKTSFLAASGLAITTDANATCTVFHSNASA